MRSLSSLSVILLLVFTLGSCRQLTNTPPPTKPTTSFAITATQILASPIVTVATSTAITLTSETPLLVDYQGSNPYRKNPRFDLAYNPLIWSIVGDEGTNLGNRLLHNTIENCYLRLEAGPMGAPYVASTSLAGRDWTILQIQPQILQYFFTIDDISFIFNLVLPEEYSPTIKSVCQAQAEEVINTFRILEKD
jgi:hypothetical protein